jgi:hypothetical protein
MDLIYIKCLVIRQFQNNRDKGNSEFPRRELTVSSVGTDCSPCGNLGEQISE